MVKKDTKWFIENALKKHGDKYDYSISEYSGWDKKVKIICRLHGVFEQKATNHINQYDEDIIKRLKIEKVF